MNRRTFLPAALALPLVPGAAREALAAVPDPEWSLDYNGVHIRLSSYSVARGGMPYDPKHPDDPFGLAEGYEPFNRVLVCRGRTDYTRIEMTADEKRLFQEAIDEYFDAIHRTGSRVNQFALEMAPVQSGMLLVQSRLLAMGKPFAFRGEHSAWGLRRKGSIMSHVYLQQSMNETGTLTNEIVVGDAQYALTICYQGEKP
jgi:hypothetical protein